MLEDQSNTLFLENRRLQEQTKQSKENLAELESLINELRDEIDLKNAMLEDQERSFNDSRHTDRFTMNQGALISQQELQDLKNQLSDKIKKMKELDEMLNSQHANFEMEIKKSNMLLNENKKLKDQNKELNFQIEDI